MSKILDTASKKDVEYFVTELTADRKSIDDDLDKYCRSWQADLGEQFGEPAMVCTGAYCGILSRGGKRVRGSLAMRSYYAFGGKNNQDALILARVLEMVHAYLLVVDDTQDNSDVRRGGPTAHVMLRDYHKSEHFRGDSDHFGRSQAINGALIGAHQALLELSKISSPHRQQVCDHLNQTLVSTAMGQFYDIYNEVVETADEHYVRNALEWKTAYYTMSNPLYMGAICAGADKAELSDLLRFAVPAGLAFQMGDDILCTFSDEELSGKPPMDDIREGKRTVLALKTLEMAPKEEALFFEQMLGNTDLSKAQFERCKKIITDCGALAESKKILQSSCDEAESIINSSNAPEDLRSYLAGLAQFLATRKS